MGSVINSFHLDNSMGFAETQRIPLRPLTLIYGANSAGTSRIVYGLVVARQAYAAIAAAGIALDMKSRDDHIEPLDEALKQFEDRAQLT
jgi:predicted ATPase